MANHVWRTTAQSRDHIGRHFGVVPAEIGLPDDRSRASTCHPEEGSISVTSDRKIEIQRKLSAMENPAWADSALLACFEVLSQSNSDVVDALSIVNGWTEGGETIKVIYRPPWEPLLIAGLVRQRYSPALLEFLYDDQLDLSAQDFGRHVALRDIAESLGSYARLLDFDSDGVGWWGDGHTIGG